MYDDFTAVLAVLTLTLSMPAVYFVGRGSGIEKGRNEAIIYCIENQNKCKIQYDYLKLQENQK